VGDVRLIGDQAAETVAQNLVNEVIEEFEKYQSAVLALTQREGATPPALPREPRALSYRVGAMLHVHPRERQQLLELDDVSARLEQELSILKRENRPAPKAIGPFSMN
jgi:ATP-dependent Lon protease